MRKNLRLAVLFVAASSIGLATSGANAQSTPKTWYGEIGLSQVTYKESGYSLKPTAIRAMVGTEVHANLAVEGMFGLGLSDDTIRIGSVNVSGEINNAWGLFLKPKVALGSNLEAFGRLGYAKTKMSISAPGFRVTDSGGDFSYGVGLSYKVTKEVSANVDYMSYYDKNGVKATGMSFGLGFGF